MKLNVNLKYTNGREQIKYCLISSTQSLHNEAVRTHDIFVNGRLYNIWLAVIFIKVIYIYKIYYYVWVPTDPWQRPCKVSGSIMTHAFIRKPNTAKIWVFTDSQDRDCVADKKESDKRKPVNRLGFSSLLVRTPQFFVPGGPGSDTRYLTLYFYFLLWAKRTVWQLQTC